MDTDRTGERRARPDAGMTLIEMMIALMIVTAAVTTLLVIITQGIKTQALAQRSDRATGATQVIESKARQIAFADLGFFNDDAGAAITAVTLPVLAVEASGVAGPVLVEEPVILTNAAGGGPAGERPAGTAAFTQPVATFDDSTAADGTPTGLDATTNFRVETFVTYVNDEDGAPSPAKRVTVVSQWAAVGGAALTGDCAQEFTECSIQSMVRAPDATDVDPTTGLAATSKCVKDAVLICEAYVRSGRVLDGSTMATDADAPEQVLPVDLFVHTASEATSVSATWSWSDRTGATVQSITHPLAATGTDTTRWTYVVPADVNVAGAVHKGEIRAGAATVTFTAVMGGAPVTRDVPSFWSYSLKRERVVVKDSAGVPVVPHATADLRDDGAIAPLDDVSVRSVSAPGWCPAGTGPGVAGTPVTVTVFGHSLGFTAGTKNAGAADTVDVSFSASNVTAAPPVTASAAKTVTAAATATTDPLRVVAHNATVQGPAGSGLDVIGGWVEADWTVPLPAGVDCVSPRIVVTVHRAADQSVTPVFATLP